MKKYFQILAIVIGLIVVTFLSAFDEFSPQKEVDGQSSKQIIVTNPEGMGIKLSIEFTKGEAHNHPLMAVWVEDTSGKYIQTLYVAKSIATGKFNYGDASSGQWNQGAIRRPAALPYWAHKRGIQGR